MEIHFRACGVEPFLSVIPRCLISGCNSCCEIFKCALEFRFSMSLVFRMLRFFRTFLERLHAVIVRIEPGNLSARGTLEASVYRLVCRLACKSDEAFAGSAKERCRLPSGMPLRDTPRICVIHFRKFCRTQPGCIPADERERICDGFRRPAGRHARAVCTHLLRDDKCRHHEADEHGKDEYRFDGARITRSERIGEALACVRS